MTDEIKVSERELQALKTLEEYYSEDFGCLSFKTISEESGLDLKYVRRTVRSLARKGLAEYVRGLFTEEGMAAGSGYCCTTEGVAYMRKITEQEEKKEAEEAAQQHLFTYPSEIKEAVRRAVLAERKRCADLVRNAQVKAAGFEWLEIGKYIADAIEKEPS